MGTLTQADDFFAVRDRLRKRYIASDGSSRTAPDAPPESARAVPLDGGFLTEIGGRLILTAPAATVSVADELPPELAESWEKASAANPYMLWLQGRFVEAEKANRNGAYWTTEDLQFGEMSVRHGPLNWLHEEDKIVGTIADNALVLPPGSQSVGPATLAGMVQPELVEIPGQKYPRPYMAAISSVWKWIAPERAALIEAAAKRGDLFYSMECVAQKMECASDGDHDGCGKSFDYMQAVARPETTCEHIAGRTSARRMVKPFFLGGAVILPPMQPGWMDARVDIVQAASLAEQAYSQSLDVPEKRWLSLMAEVIRFSQQ